MTTKDIDTDINTMSCSSSNRDTISISISNISDRIKSNTNSDIKKVQSFRIQGGSRKGISVRPIQPIVIKPERKIITVDSSSVLDRQATLMDSKSKIDPKDSYPLNNIAYEILTMAYPGNSIVPKIVIELLKDYNPFSYKTGLDKKQVTKYLQLVLRHTPDIAKYFISCLPDARDLLPPHLLARIPQLNESGRRVSERKPVIKCDAETQSDPFHFSPYELENLYVPDITGSMSVSRKLFRPKPAIYKAKQTSNKGQMLGKFDSLYNDGKHSPRSTGHAAWDESKSPNFSLSTIKYLVTDEIKRQTRESTDESTYKSSISTTNGLPEGPSYKRSRNDTFQTATKQITQPNLVVPKPVVPKPVYLSCVPPAVYDCLPATVYRASQTPDELMRFPHGYELYPDKRSASHSNPSEQDDRTRSKYQLTEEPIVYRKDTS